jgi:hypothetical protein
MPELPPESIVLWRYLDPAERKAMYRRHHAGEVVQLHRGAYVDSLIWQSLDLDAKHRARCRAIVVHFRDEYVFSHLSAAALWRLPRMGSWPTKPHVTGRFGEAASRASFVRHGLGVPEHADIVDDLRVTGLARTVVDVASTLTFAPAVAIADAALRRNEHPVAGVPASSLSRSNLLRELAHVPASHGAVKAARVVEFADGRADRPGESMSRASMHLAGVTAPKLQVRLLGASGKEYIVDFWWQEFNTIGEFDGKYKYTDPQHMGGRTPQQVLYDEKIREDDLRAAGHGFTRWPWSTAISPTLLRAQLLRAGVR